MYFIYEFFQRVLFLVLVGLSYVIKNEKFQRFVSLRNPKQFYAAVKKAQKIYQKESSGPIFWFHVASAGELEQAIPIARKLHDKMGARYFVTYYSPSTEPFLKNFPAVIGVAGLPLDIRSVYQKLFELLPASKIFFVRYDLWPSLLVTCQKNRVEINLIAGSIVSNKKSFFPAIQKHWSSLSYKKMDHIFAVSEEDVGFFRKLLSPSSQIYYSGDAKWARALERSKNQKNDVDFTRFSRICLEQKEKTDRKNIVFGSPYGAEQKVALLCAALKEHVFVIYVPHDVDPKSCQNAMSSFAAAQMKCILYSTLLAEQNADLSGYQAIIVDKVGFLAEIYGLADVAVIGGGFDGKLHNVLEAAAHGVPVLIGDQIASAYEAKLLAAEEAAISFASINEMFQFLSRWVSLDEKGSIDLGHPIHRLKRAKSRALNFFDRIPDTSEVILQALLKVKNE